MTRQYYCWKVCLTFRCGCTEYTPTAHRCGPSREGCNRWLTYKRTDKACEEHRLLEGWGLNDNNNNSSSSNNNSGGRQVEGGRGRGESGEANEPWMESTDHITVGENEDTSEGVYYEKKTTLGKMANIDWVTRKESPNGKQLC
ncbi:hypothetical protein N657DRAFT_632401 [Parathielavia appendiculata]|uniref:Uncharacterized protein n=1 Tax=Parathielavia appendiculata TaxID=2587402 RepID=A0AAN6U4F8_9PEZI|nr:hypothetical protein N657DRAFT_632401 [Parathielavia appendiculata]